MREDTFFAGYASGAVGAICNYIYGVIAKSLGWTDRAFLDFSQILLMYKTEPGALAIIIGLLGHITFGGILGCLFITLIRSTSSRYFWFKSFIYGMILWFVLLGAGTVFKMPLFTLIPSRSVLSILIGSIVYSLSNGLVLFYLEKKTRLA